MNCKKCGKHILQPNVAYGINPNAVCNCSEPQKSEATMPTLSNEDWLSDLIISLVKENGAELMHERLAHPSVKKTELAILSKLESIEQEAYKKGYIQKGIDDLTGKG